MFFLFVSSVQKASEIVNFFCADIKSQKNPAFAPCTKHLQTNPHYDIMIHANRHLPKRKKEGPKYGTTQNQSPGRQRL